MGKIDPLTYFLVILFGISSWISINSIWVELPIFVNQLPEKWNLPSFFAIIIQLGNFATIIFTLYNIYIPKLYRRYKLSLNDHSHSNEHPEYFIDLIPIYVVITLEMASCIAIIFKWNNIFYVAGAKRSVSLFVIIFFLALSNCSSSVLNLPFLSHFDVAYITAYYIGSGLSGFIPSLLSLFQGIGGTPSCINVTINDILYPYQISRPQPLQPKFYMSTFFTIIATILLGTLISFTLLNTRCIRKRRLASRSITDKSSSLEVIPLSHTLSDLPTKHRNVPSSHSNVAVINKICVNTDNFEDSNDTHIDNNNNYYCDKNNPNIAEDVAEQNLRSTTPSPINTSPERGLIQNIPADLIRSSPSEKEPLRSHILCLIALTWISALANGIIPSIQSYATLPYGNRTFHLAVSLASMANPLASFAAFFYPITRVYAAATLFFKTNCCRRVARSDYSLTTSKSFTGYYLLTLIATLLSIYIFVQALLSPYPLLVGRLEGTILTILVWISVQAMFSYIKVCLASEFHKKGRRWLLWCGVATQTGSAIGAFTIFIAINVFKLFKSGRTCGE